MASLAQAGDSTITEICLHLSGLDIFGRKEED
jgi:hypothetical protein